MQNYHSDKVMGVELIDAWTFSLPFPDETFDLITLMSVFEHIFPKERQTSIAEIARVLSKDGLLLAQMPNMLFPIEIHSWLPLQQFLPRKLAFQYAKGFSPNAHIRGLGMDWYRITVKELITCAEGAGLKLVQSEKCRYPKSCLPKIGKIVYYLAAIVPTDYICVFQKRKHG